VKPNSLARILGFFRGKWFIRIHYGAIEQWEDARGSADDLAGPAFSCTDEDVSVYRVSSAVEEARAIAACQLSRNVTPNKPIIALRFRRKEISESGIKIIKRRGITGVASVDREHRDLVGDENKYISLAKKILDLQREGHDRVRRMHKNRLLAQFNSLRSSPCQSLSEMAMERCVKLVDKMETKTTGN